MANTQISGATACGGVTHRFAPQCRARRVEATAKELEKVQESVRNGRLKGEDKIGVIRAGPMLNGMEFNVYQLAWIPTARYFANDSA